VFELESMSCMMGCYAWY